MPQGAESYDMFVANQLMKEVIWWMLIAGVPLFVLTLLREFVVDVVAGVLWRFRSGYDADEIVRIDGQWGRMVSLGIMRTKFYLYEFDSEKKSMVVTGTSISILNSELRRCKIERQLEMVNTPASAGHQ